MNSICDILYTSFSFYQYYQINYLRKLSNICISIELLQKSDSSNQRNNLSHPLNCMLHRNPSITIRTLQSINSNHSLENQDSWYFQYIECSKVPQQDQQKMTLLDGQNKIIIKTHTMPHGYVMLFTYAFLKLYFVEKYHFKKSIQTLFAILDDDEFKFFIPEDSSSPFYLDWSNSKIKRMTAEYFKDLQAGKYQNVDQIIKFYPDFYKAFFLFSISILKYCEKCQDFKQFVYFEIVKEVLFDYFDIQAYAGENFITIPECRIKAQTPNPENLYILNMDQKKQSTVGINTSQSLQIQNQCNQNNQVFNLKLQLISSSDFQQELQKSLKSRNLLQITNRAKHTKSRFSLRGEKKTERLRHQSEPNELHQFEYKQNDDSNTYRNTQQSQNIIFRTENNKKNNPRNSQHTKKIQKLFELTNRKTSTQKSIYDDPKQVESDEYSVLDESIPTSKKINQRKLSKENIEMPTVSKTINFSNDSLINKWYEFCKIRKNKSAQLEINMDSIEKSMNSTESSFKKSNVQSKQEKPKAQKHDFRKIKTRNRKSQDFNFQQQQMKLKQEAKESPSQNSSKFAKQTKCQKEQTSSNLSNLNSHKECSKYFVPTNPNKKYIKPQNRYTKYGYINMNISQQFTDSLILKQLDEKVHSHVKDMKEKARQERQSVKLMLNLQNQF